jgi:hypothetical protein
MKSFFSTVVLVLATLSGTTLAQATNPPGPLYDNVARQIGLVNVEMCGQIAPCTPSVVNDPATEALATARLDARAITTVAERVEKYRRGLASLRSLQKKEVSDRIQGDADLSASIEALEGRIVRLEAQIGQGCRAFMEDTTSSKDEVTAQLCLRLLGQRHDVDRAGIELVGGARIVKRTTTTAGDSTSVEEEFGEVAPSVMDGSGVGSTGCRRFSAIRGADAIHAGSVVRAEEGCGKSSALDRLRVVKPKGLSKGARVAIYIASVVAAGAAGGGIAHLAHPGNDRDVVRGGVHESHNGKSAAPYGAAIGVGVGALALLPLILGGDD